MAVISGVAGDILSGDYSKAQGILTQAWQRGDDGQASALDTLSNAFSRVRAKHSPANPNSPDANSFAENVLRNVTRYMPAEVNKALFPPPKR